MDDEITSINAIYGDDTLHQKETGSRTCTLRIPSLTVSLLVDFPNSYPDEPPKIIGPASVGAELRKGAAKDVVELAQSIIQACFAQGQPCLYEVIEQLLEENRGLHLTAETNIQDGVYVAQEPQEECSHSTIEDPLADIDPNWTISEPAIEKKSVFIARAARCTHPSQAKLYVQHLLATDKKAAKATHNITAWRMKQPDSGVVFQDCDDDGEAAAGGRLLQLLQLMDVWNAVVVVTRWYGGIHLGPARFQLINQVAREAIIRGRF